MYITVEIHAILLFYLHVMEEIKIYRQPCPRVYTVDLPHGTKYPEDKSFHSS